MNKNTATITEEEFTLFSHLQFLFGLLSGLLPGSAKKSRFWMATQLKIQERGIQVDEGVWIVFNSSLKPSIVMLYTPWGEISLCSGIKDAAKTADLVYQHIRKLYKSERRVRVRSVFPKTKIIEINPNGGDSILRREKRSPTDLLQEWQALTALFETKYGQICQRT